jgi:hypothetical protein
MLRIRPHPRHPTSRHRTSPDGPTDGCIDDAELALLSCFGAQLDGCRHRQHLHGALRTAGYSAAAARHLVRVSPLLVRDLGPHYRLKAHDG